MHGTVDEHLTGVGILAQDPCASISTARILGNYVPSDSQLSLPVSLAFITLIAATACELDDRLLAYELN